MVEPQSPLFQEIGNAYVTEIIQTFGTSNFYSADVFNEMPPNSTDLDYLRDVNVAVFNSIKSVDKNAVWVMQGKLYTDDFIDYVY